MPLNRIHTRIQRQYKPKLFKWIPTAAGKINSFAFRNFLTPPHEWFRFHSFVQEGQGPQRNQIEIQDKPNVYEEPISSPENAIVPFETGPTNAISSFIPNQLVAVTSPNRYLFLLISCVITIQKTQIYFELLGVPSIAKKRALKELQWIQRSHSRRGRHQWIFRINV